MTPRATRLYSGSNTDTRLLPCWTTRERGLPRRQRRPAPCSASLGQALRRRRGARSGRDRVVAAGAERVAAQRAGEGRANCPATLRVRVSASTAYSLQLGAKRQLGPQQRADRQLVEAHERGERPRDPAGARPLGSVTMLRPDPRARAGRRHDAKPGIEPAAQLRVSSLARAGKRAYHDHRAAGSSSASRARICSRSRRLHPVTRRRPARHGGRQYGGTSLTSALHPESPGRPRRARRAALDTPSARPPDGRYGCARVLRRAARASGGKLVAALAPTSGQDGSTCTGTHAQAKTMRLSPPAIVGLKRALAQGQLRVGYGCSWRSPCNTTKATARPTLEGTGAARNRSNARPPVTSPSSRRHVEALITLREQEKRVRSELWTTRRRERSGAASVSPSPTWTSAVHLAAGSGVRSPCTACG